MDRSKDFRISDKMSKACDSKKRTEDIDKKISRRKTDKNNIDVKRNNNTQVPMGKFDTEQHSYQ